MNSIDPKKIKYMELVYDPDFNEMTRVEQEKVIGVDRQTLWRWSKEVDWEAVREETKKLFSQDAPRVFHSIVKKAIKGEAKSQELFLSYFLNWSPKQSLELSRGLDKELTPEQTLQAAKDLLKLLPEAQRVELLKEVPQTPVLEAKVEGGESLPEGGNPDA